MADENKADLKEAMEVMFGAAGAEGIVETKETAAPAKKASPADGAPAAEPTAQPATQPGTQPAATPAAAAPPNKPRATPRSRPAAAPRDTDGKFTAKDVADAALAGAAAAERKKGKDATDALPADGDLDETQRETVVAMEHMGRKDGKYATLAERTREYWKLERERAAKWEKDNAGKKYNPDDEEHADWYEKHEPQFDDKALDLARKEVERESLKAELSDEVRREMSVKERIAAEKELQKSEAEEVKSVADTAQFELIKALVPDADKIFVVEGKTQLTDAQWEALAEKDPTAAEILRDEGDFLARKMTELERLNRYPATYSPNRKNRLHVAIRARILEAEEEIMEMAPKDQIYKGRQFISQDDFVFKRHEIRNDPTMKDAEKAQAMRELHDKHWMLSPSHAKALIIAQHRTRAEEKLGKARKLEDRWKKRFGGTAGTPPPTETSGAAPTAAAAAATPAATPAAEPAPKPKPAREPAAPSGGDSAMPTGDNGTGTGGGALKALADIGI